MREQIKEVPVCKRCKFCTETGRRKATTYGVGRKTYYCKHPGLKEMTNDILGKRDSGFINFGENTYESPLVTKTSPRWCPRRKEHREKGCSENTILTVESFGPDNRDKRIGHSLYRIASDQCRPPYTWHILETYNNQETGEWSRARGCFTEDLQEVIRSFNAIHREKEIIERSFALQSK